MFAKIFMIFREIVDEESRIGMTYREKRQVSLIESV